MAEECKNMKMVDSNVENTSCKNHTNILLFRVSLSTSRLMGI